VAVVVAVLAAVGGSAAAAAGPRTQPTARGFTAPSATVQPHAVATIRLKPPGGVGPARGVADVIAEGSLRAFALTADGLAPTRGFAYAVWLYDSRRVARLIGFIDQQVTSRGTAKAISVLPAGASRYRYLIVTRETRMRPTRPGPTALEGRLRLGRAARR
jgi:hypothetical protein